MFGGNHKSFVPDRDIPSLAGKVILITGGNDGIGKQTALELAKHEPTELWIAGRNQTSGDAAVEQLKKAGPSVKVKFLQMDLSSFASVKTAAETFLAAGTRLDILICNAGLMSGGDSLSTDGFELRMAVNHLGHALLMNLLAPLMLRTAAPEAPASTGTSGGWPRIVSLSSAGHRFVPGAGIEFEHLRKAVVPKRTSVDMYCQAKLAQVLYARVFAARHPRIVSVSVNPGDVRTNLYKDTRGPWYFELIKKYGMPFICSPIEDGIKNSLWASTSSKVVSGEYYDPVGKGNTASALSRDEKLVRKLEEWTEEALIGQYP